ncbi:LemA family protein [Parapedobacter indicus]|uniref:LemA protein n=1 Tax=Parapedobacter indicus TaxID=1477437 RepID=A0A1I3LF64_9SPHI|nr:LemA family protein [Parapedobacter indicus]PPL01517.1 LemA protein [Parapedobacter indicus]SFI83419.1 LemA protein [Parapedobacter indicus]
MMFVLITLLVLILLLAAGSYNALQKLAQDVREKASNAQVAISKKLALINQLIDVVKNYQEGEQLVQLKVSQDTSATDLASSYQQSGTVLATVQGIAEKFPNLKANEQYHRLVDSIQHCEQNIQESREKYNHAVKEYNTKRLRIPTVFMARAMGFPEAPYLQFDVSGMNEITSLQDFKTDDGERLQQLFTGAGNKIAGLATQAGKAGKELVDKVKESQKDSAPPKNSAGDG